MTKLFIRFTMRDLSYRTVSLLKMTRHDIFHHYSHLNRLYIVAGLSLNACVTINVPMGSTDTSNHKRIVTQYPVETALLNIYTKARTKTLIKANDDQNTVFEMKVVPKGEAVFDNQKVQSAETTYAIRSNGIVDQQLIYLNYYTLNPTKFYGFTNNLGQYSVATQITDIPKMAATGDSSRIITEHVYSNSKQDVLVDSYTQTWSLSQASADTAWFCINVLANPPLSKYFNNENSECYLINTQGDLLKSKLTEVYLTKDGVNTVVYNSQ